MLQSSASSRPRTTRRWLRVLLGAAALIVLIIVAAQIVFFTDLPRSFVVNAVQKQLGLRLSAKSLSTGFFGHTTLDDVTLTLPLSDKAFLTVPVLKLKHTWLPLLLVGKSLNIDEISVDHARLNVVQDPRGSWNLEEVAQLLARAGGGNNANQQTQENEIPLLPELHVTDATLIVTDNQHRSTTIDHLNVTGTPNGPLVWEYHATVPDHLDLTGKVAPGGVSATSGKSCPPQCWGLGLALGRLLASVGAASGQMDRPDQLRKPRRSSRSGKSRIRFTFPDRPA